MITQDSFRSPSTGQRIRAVMFDTFGTVVDWRTGIAAEVRRVAERYGVGVRPEAFTDAWRRKYQPSMEQVRSHRREFVPLDRLHRENLEITLGEFGIDLPDDAVDELNRAWERLPAWDDSIEGLLLLKRHYLVGPLSNANTSLLVWMAKHANLPWDVIVGSDVTQVYKPDRDAYLRTAQILRLKPGQVMLAAAHNDDLAAARDAGLATGLILRPTEFGPGQTTDLVAASDWDAISASIVGLAQQLGCSPSL